MWILQKVIVTAVAGGLAYLATNAANQPPIWQWTMSVFVGGIVLLVQFLIDLADESRRSAVLIRKMNEAATALAETEKVFGSDSLTRLVKATGALDRRDDPLLRFAQQQIGEMTDLFEDLRSGRAAHEGENPDWLLGLTDTARATIDATSLTSFDKAGRFKGYVDEGPVWEGELGQRYLLRQLAAIERKVRIRRQRISYEFETAKVAGDSSNPFTDVALIVGTKHLERRREVFEELWAAGRDPASPK